MARWFSSHGHRGTHVFDLGLQAADDSVIWEHARKSNAVIIRRSIRNILTISVIRRSESKPW